MTYIDSKPVAVLAIMAGNGRREIIRDPGHSWADFTAKRIWWIYPDRADAILAGNDSATQADLAAWNRLGRRAAA